jgi:hypothetical protein
MPVTAQDGSSTTISYGGTDLGEVTGIDWSGMERAIIESTNLATADAKTYIAASIYDAGSVSVEIDVIGENAMTLMTTLQADPEAAGATLVITLPTTVAYTCQALVQSFDPLSVTSGEKVTASITFKLTGAVS